MERDRLDRKIRSVLLVDPTRPESGFVTEFRSGRRHYACRAFSLNDRRPKSGDAPVVALLFERREPLGFYASRVAFHFRLTQREQETLKYVMQGLTNKEIANQMGISPNRAGGPNIPFANDGRVAACIAHTPGRPTHVLLSDGEAEHIPGCNMAFRRDCLQAVGGFDTQFRVAGDDVDICWRIRQSGGKLGFSPAAIVWHHCRSTLSAFWKQQVGYGKAEAMLEGK